MFGYDMTPFLSPNPRALSDYQEKAQLLTGLCVPQAVLEGLIAGACDPGEHVGVVNLSPYDACVEKTCLGWHIETPGQRMTCLALSTDMDVANYSEKLVAMYLFEDGNFKLFTVTATNEYDFNIRGTVYVRGWQKIYILQ